VIDVTQSFGDLVPRGAEAAVFFVQVKLYNPANGALILGAPSAVVVVDDPCF
jgi:hypothetical protein